MSFHCVEDDDYLEADAFLASIDGPSTPFLIGPQDWRGRPWNIDPLSGAKITPRSSAISARSNPAFESNQDTSGVLKFYLLNAAPLNSTSIIIKREKGGYLKKGQYFSIGNRLHIITDLTTPDPVDPVSGLPIPGNIGAKIRPWLRDDYPAGFALNFSSPTATMRLSADSTSLLERTTSPLSDLSLSIIEHLS